jgi:hypothetical protein
MADHFTRIVEEYEASRKRQRDTAREALHALSVELRAAGVSSVCATFNGYGDEGTIESVEFLDAQGELVTSVRPERFPNLEESFYPLLPTGYEQNEGSSGTVSLDVEHGRVVVDVNWNVTTTENEHYEV